MTCPKVRWDMSSRRKDNTCRYRMARAGQIIASELSLVLNEYRKDNIGNKPTSSCNM